MKKLKFAFNESKAVQALAFIAREHPGMTPLFVSKVLFYAEKWHVNRYGRPIIADTYIAMPQGPVPSAVRDFIESNWSKWPEPSGFRQAVVIYHAHGYKRLKPGPKETDLDLLSETDRECLSEAIAFCSEKTPEELSRLTHLEKAWQNADVNQPMDYADFIDDDNPHKADILSMLEECAAYGVL